MNVYFLNKADKLSRFSKWKIEGESCTIKKELKEKQMNMLAKKVKKELKLNQKEAIIVNKKLCDNEKLLNILDSNEISVVDGRWLMKYLIFDIVNYIIKQKNAKAEEMEIAILVNYIDEADIENIKVLANKFKRTRIVTNHAEKLQRLEDELLQSKGIMLIFSNNKKKSLNNSDIIVNMDFVQDVLNTYNIKNDAVIVNLEGSMRINKKRFNGMIVNDYDLQYSDDMDSNYFAKHLWEAKLYKKAKYSEIRDAIAQEGVSVDKLIGINGKVM